MRYDVGQIGRWREMAKVLDATIGDDLSNFISIADLCQFQRSDRFAFAFLRFRQIVLIIGKVIPAIA